MTKDRFLQQVDVTDEDSAIRSVLEVTFKRNPIYNGNVSLQDKHNLKQYLRLRLQDFRNIAETDYVPALVNLANDVSATYGHILNNGRFRIGTVQNMVNIYRKMLWCLNLGDKPFHCPVNTTTLRAIRNYQDRWTQSDDINWYLSIIDRIQLSVTDVAEWELALWSR